MLRSLARQVAHNQMKAQGLGNPNKKVKGAKGEKATSYFSRHWREYAAMPWQRKVARKAEIIR